MFIMNNMAICREVRTVWACSRVSILCFSHILEF